MIDAEIGPGIFGVIGEGEPAAEDEPSRAFACPVARRRAFEASVDAGRPWPPPEGLVSASLGAALGLRR